VIPAKDTLLLDTWMMALLETAVLKQTHKLLLLFLPFSC